MSYKLHHGDCLEVLSQYDDNVIDTVITDPPYGLKFMGRDWDYGIPGVRYWKEILRVAKPGAMLLAFGGTRTHHRLMCAIEDAGWELKNVMSWVYGSGFPGGLNISKAIDKAAGAEREKVRPPNGFVGAGNDRPFMYKENRMVDGPIPATPEAQLWDGWGTRLKPAWEPIIIAMKPRDGTFANNALKWGVAGFWVDGGRIGINGNGPNKRNGQGYKERGNIYGGGNGLPDHEDYSPNSKGRWPANFVLQHAAGCVCRGTREVKGHKGYPNGPGGDVSRHADVITGGKEWANTPYEGHADSNGNETIADWDCVPGCPVRMLAEQSGDKMHSAGKARSGSKNPRPQNRNGYVPIAPTGSTGDVFRYGDSGTAARFFYQAKASPSERHEGCDDLYWRREKDAPTGFVQITQQEYESLPKRQRAQGNIHPTVKPVELLKYLANMYRTPFNDVVLDPFMGSGSTGVACLAVGRNFIGIDKMQNYITIAEARLSNEEEKVRQLKLLGGDNG